MISDLAKSGRSRVHTPAFMSKVSEYIHVAPSVSSCHLALRLLSRLIQAHIVRGGVAYPYKVSVQQELKPDDATKRVEFCTWLLRIAHN